MPCSRAAASASGTPATVSWSLSASSSTPAAAAARDDLGGRRARRRTASSATAGRRRGRQASLTARRLGRSPRRGGFCATEGRECVMSTGFIIAIVVVVLILIALLVMLPRMRAKAEERKAQKELECRRDRVATENREAASDARHRGREGRAGGRDRPAEGPGAARRGRALEAEAKMHERGLADDQLVEDHERDRFAGVDRRRRHRRDADRTDDGARDDATTAPPCGTPATDADAARRARPTRRRPPDVRAGPRGRAAREEDQRTAQNAQRRSRPPSRAPAARWRRPRRAGRRCRSPGRTRSPAA